MSVLIKGMEMPKDCYSCPFAHDGWPDEWEMHCLFLDRQVGYFGKKLKVPKDCPLVEVPTPHGRLKDEQELIKAINEKVDNVSENRGRGATIPSIAWFSGVSSALSIIEAAPVIIEAEKERDE